MTDYQPLTSTVQPVIRWYQSRQNQVNLASLFLSIATFALANLGALGLTPGRAFYVSIGLTLMVNLCNIVLRNNSEGAVVGNKDQVQQAKFVAAVEQEMRDNDALTSSPLMRAASTPVYRDKL